MALNIAAIQQVIARVLIVGFIALAPSAGNHSIGRTCIADIERCLASAGTTDVNT